MSQTSPRYSTRFAVIPAVFIAILAIYPQFNLLIMRGAEWQGSYYVSNYDETAYSAYTNALANGKPRVYDPFVDRQDNRESLYSIQFIPAYFSAITAAIFGGSTSAAFIFLCLFCAVISSLSIFWLLRLVTQNETISAVGVLVILCLGTLTAYQGELRFWIEGNVLVDFLPFLRRYQPGFAFGLFFVFCGLVYRSFSARDDRSSIVSNILAGLTFSVLVFSYFYLWTAALAWLALAAIFSFLVDRVSRRRIIIGLSIISGFAAASLVPYFYMLSRRSTEMDSVQLLTLTHMPDLASISLFVGLVFAIGFIYLLWSRKATASPGRAAIGLAFALTPVLLFNQQIVTGRSLQPVHYEIFISNYMVLTAGIILLSSFLDRYENPGTRFRKAFVYVGIVAAAWGFIEASGATRRSNAAAFLRDESVAAIRFADSDAATRPDIPHVMLASNFVTSDFIPTVATIRPLWNPHTSSAGGVSIAENKRLFYMYLYFSGFTVRDLSDALQGKSFEVTAAIFGSERALPALGGTSKSISLQEIRNEVEAFQKFSDSLTAADAFRPTISYLMVPAKAEPSYANVDRWYQRDEGRTFGIFKLYKLSKHVD